MKSIWKYQLTVKEKQTIRGPIIRALTAQEQYGVPCIWATVETDDPERDVDVYLMGTGCVNSAPFGARYIDTMQLENGMDGDMTVLHCFVVEA